MELVYAAALAAIPLGVIARRGLTPRNCALVWFAFFLIAAFSRFWIQSAPQSAAAAGFFLTALLAILAWRSPGAGPKLRRTDLPWILGAALILPRSYFPQCDVDSMLYHVMGVQWLHDRAFLPALQQLPGAQHLWIYLLGFEEFLSIPGLLGDLPLAAALVGGILKAFGIATLVSLVPTAWPLLRAAVAYVVLLDDAYVFSGLNRSVYLNPSLIPLNALMVWFLWRAWRGQRSALVWAIALALGVGSVKYHGLYFSVLPFLAATGFLLRERRPPSLSNASLFALCAGGALALSVFGLHWVETGNPLAPSGSFFQQRLVRGVEYLQLGFAHSSWWEAARHPLRRLIFPGAIAFKATAVLLFPAIGLWMLQWVRPVQGLRRRWIGLAVFCFVLSALWTITTEAIRHSESRYPRYAAGIATLGLAATALALRKRIPWRKRSKQVELALGFGVFAFFAYSLDRRQVNIPLDVRPTWRDIAWVARARLEGRPSLRADAPYLARIVEPYIPGNLPEIAGCLERLEPIEGLRLTRGDGLAIYWSLWPLPMVAPNAILLDWWNGGGYLQLPNGAASLMEGGVHFAIVPREMRSGEPWFLNPGSLGGPYVRQGAYGPLERIRFETEPLCVTRDLKLVRIR
jgi:hypothetical protein